VRIIVVGTIVLDSIDHSGGDVTDSLGGIAHTISVLSALGGKRHRIVPVCRVGSDCRHRVEDWVAGLDGVSLEAVTWTDAPNPRVRLCYAEAADEGERVERLQHAPAPLQPADLTRAGDADIALINCITGSDCAPEAIHAARAASLRLYLDVHSLAYGTAADGRRFYRARDDWHRWLAVPDAVQSNRAEAATICGLSPADEVDTVIAAARTRMQRSTPQALTPAVWLLTLGAAGVAVLQRANDEVTVTRVAAPVVDVVDPTGAGDAFGAGFVDHWATTDDPVSAARVGTRIATAAALVRGAPSRGAFRHALATLNEE